MGCFSFKIENRRRGSFGLDGRRKSTEREIQSSIVKWARLVAPDARTIHVPMNQTTEIAGALMNAAGAVKGVPDLIVIAPGGKTLFMEVKTPEGRLSPDQKKFAGDLQSMGHQYALVRSIDDARVAFARADIKTREFFKC